MKSKPDRPIRLSRTESQAATRQEILKTAGILFAREGFGGASIEAIAAEAGYSKGAVYSNFDSKEMLFLEVTRQYQRDSLASVMAIFTEDASSAEIIERLAQWANHLAKAGLWGFLALEYARHVGAGSSFKEAQISMIRDNWRIVGEKLRYLFRDDFPATSEMLGTLVFELTHAPLSGIATASTAPTVGDLVRLTFNGLLLAYGIPD